LPLVFSDDLALEKELRRAISLPISAACFSITLPAPVALNFSGYPMTSKKARR
jgi:hypothetical protein